MKSIGRRVSSAAGAQLSRVSGSDAAAPAADTRTDEEREVQLLQALRSIPMFESSSADDLQASVGSLESVAFKSGAPIVTQGDAADGMFILDSGTASVEIGGESILDYSPGDFFGELGLLSAAKNTRSATVRATSAARISRRRGCHLMAPPLPLVGVSIWINRGCHENDSLADGY